MGANAVAVTCALVDDSVIDSIALLVVASAIDLFDAIDVLDIVDDDTAVGATDFSEIVGNTRLRNDVGVDVCGTVGVVISDEDVAALRVDDVVVVAGFAVMQSCEK
jgi:hypothetical protein